jgi:hypothetical protein
VAIFDYESDGRHKSMGAFDTTGEYVASVFAEASVDSSYDIAFYFQLTADCIYCFLIIQ